jgi:GT2 family glycosyltransferase
MLQKARHHAGNPVTLSRYSTIEANYHNMFSILVCCGNASPEDIAKTLHALSRQSFRNFELIILGRSSANSFPVISGPTRGIFWIAETTERPLQYSSIVNSLRGDYSLILAAGDAPRPSMLREVNNSIVTSKAFSEVDAVIFDHTLGDPQEARYLPGWDPDLLEFLDYIGRACCLSRKTILENWKSEDRNSLRAAMLRVRRLNVVHIQEVLAHFAGQIPTAQPIPPPHQDLPPLSVVIPNRNGLHLLTKCVVFLKGMKSSVQLVIVDNASDDPQIFDFYQSLQAEFDTQIVHFDQTFNYSAMINLGVSEAKHEFVLLLNNDVAIDSATSVETALSYAHREGVGVIGSLLRYPDGLVQHAGMVLRTASDGTADTEHILRFSSGSEGLFIGALTAPKNWQSVTGAFQLIKRSTFFAAGGYDEVNLPLEHNDVDFCLSVRKLGLRVVCLPLHDVTHDESSTRSRMPIDKTKRLNEEARSLMTVRWLNEFSHDPFVNKHLVLLREPAANRIKSIAWSLCGLLKSGAASFLSLMSRQGDASHGDQSLRCNSRQLQPGVCILGPLTSATELGMITRALGRACDVTRMPLSYFNLGSKKSKEFSSLHTFSKLRTDRSVALCVLDVGQLQNTIPHIGEGRRRIAYALFEESVTREAVGPLETFEQIWVSSPFVAKCLREHLRKPVHVFPVPLHTSRRQPTRGSRPYLNFLVEHCTDHPTSSGDVIAAIEAFRTAFPSKTTVRLTVVTDSIIQLDLFKKVRRHAKWDRRIVFASRAMMTASEFEERYAPYIYFSLQQTILSNFRMARAIADGNPVLVTCHGAALDLVSIGGIRLINGKSSEQMTGSVFGAVEPDASSVVSELQRIAADPEAAFSEAANALELMQQSRAYQVVGQAIRAHLQFPEPTDAAQWIDDVTSMVLELQPKPTRD